MIGIIKRVLANVVDIFVFMFVLVSSILFMVPIFLPYFEQAHVPAIASFISVILINFIIQYPFLKVNQTVGKAFFGLEIVSTDESRPVDVSLIVQREIFGKLATCYIICIPVFYGKKGGHEIMTETEVVNKQKQGR